MYGLINKITAKPGQRDALLEIMLKGNEPMLGCLSYVIATDPTDADAIWVTEVWEYEANHEESLSIPQVRATIERGRPMVAGITKIAVTTPLGGIGLAAENPG